LRIDGGSVIIKTPTTKTAKLNFSLLDLNKVLLVCILIFVSSASKCIFPTDQIQQAIDQIDKGVAEIQGESSKWNSTVKDIAENLPKEAKEIVRNELTQLVERSTISVGVEFRCNVDFLANRAIQGLLRIKALLLKQDPPAILPSLCQISPGFLNLNEPVASRSNIVIGGYDMDKKDSHGHGMKYVLFSDATQQKFDMDEARIGRTTHYVNTLNTSGADWEAMLKTRKISKIQMFWNDAKMNAAEILIISKNPQKKEVTADLGSVSFTPPHVGNGDADFNTASDRFMSFRVTAEAKVEDNKIMTRVFMSATEARPDFTEVDGWSDWNVAYTPPDGWKILSFSPNTKSKRSGRITQQGARVENLSPGELVTRFSINGDHDGNEAGSWTSVIARFNNQVKIQIIEDLGPKAPTRAVTLQLPDILATKPRTLSP
jgi:hypothetical protein